MFSLFCLMLLSHSIFVKSTENNTSWDDNASKPKSIFILAGQSNMAGRGSIVGGIYPPECQPNPKILRLNASLKWEEAQDPLHCDIDVGKACGVGPGMPFANSVLKRDPSIGVIGLVPCAIGGTNLSEWSPDQKLYNQMLSRATVALSGGGGQIRALLWYQGETDAKYIDAAYAYKSKLEKLITRLRSDLQLPTLPVIEVAIRAPDEGGEYLDIVRASQMGIDLPNVKCIDARELELKADHVHLTTQAEVKLGKMLADAFLN